VSDSGASHHMIEAHDLFSSLTERDSNVHVELGDDAKYVVKGEGTIMFHLELGGSFDAQVVLYVPGLKNNFLSVSSMEDKGFVIIFQRGKVLIRLEKLSQDRSWSLGLERALYTSCKEILFIPWYMTMTTYVSYGTRVWDTYTRGCC
jgi:hypothetical protein